MNKRAAGLAAVRKGDPLTEWTPPFDGAQSAHHRVSRGLSFPHLAWNRPTNVLPFEDVKLKVPDTGSPCFKDSR